MKFILGKKLGMTQVFGADKKVTPVTLIDAGPCWITQVRNLDKDGYWAAQIGFEEIKKVNKPKAGHLKNVKNLRYLREFRLTEGAEFKKGDEISLDIFEEGEKVKVSAVSKGKGFAGVVKRHGFAGGPASHGNKDRLRAPGSIGCGFPERVWKGRKMAGLMGNERTTLRGLKIIKIDAENNILAIKGAIPGKIGTLVEIVSVK